MREFFKGGFLRIRQEFENCDRLLKTEKRAAVAKVVHMRRLLSFPLIYTSAMLDLHYSGVLDIIDYYEDLRGNDTYMKEDIIDPFMSFGPAYHILFCKCVIDMDFELNKSPLAKKIVRQWVLDKIGTLSTMQFVKIFQAIEVNVNHRLLKDEASWKTFLFMQEKTYENYDWSTDPEAPISLKNKIKETIRILKNIRDKPSSLNSAIMSLKQNQKGFSKSHEVCTVYAEVAKHFGINP
jgi:hypothetical protein